MITTYHDLSCFTCQAALPHRRRPFSKIFGRRFGAMSSFVAFLSGADQYGRWVPEEEVTASAYLGGSTVDFSQALFKFPVPEQVQNHGLELSKFTNINRG